MKGACFYKLGPFRIIKILFTYKMDLKLSA